MKVILPSMRLALVPAGAAPCEPAQETSMEQIVGPVSGFYVACYASPSMDGTRFTSYAKICRRKPADYWSADCLFKLFGGEHHASATAALATAKLRAFAQIDHLPSLECSTFGLEMFETGVAQSA